MSNFERHSDPFWRQCYTAALTGLMFGAAIRREAGAEPALSATKDLAVRDADGSVDGDEVVVAAAQGFAERVAIVREAVAIANVSLDLIKGKPAERGSISPRVPDRPAITTIGHVVPQNKRS